MLHQNQGQAANAIRYLMVGYPKRVREQRLIAMLKCFVDDSGSDVNPHGAFILAGYVMEEARWEAFAERWDACLRRPDFVPLEYFKMSEAEAGYGEFNGIDSVFRKRKVKDLAEIVHECMPTPIVLKLQWKDYETLVRGKVDSRLDNPYAILFIQVLKSVAQMQIVIDANIRPKYRKDFMAIKPVEFVFDEQGFAGLQSRRWFDEYREKLVEPFRTVLSNSPQFRDDKRVNPLQAADLLAWHMRRINDFPKEEGRWDTIKLLVPDYLLDFPKIGWAKQITREQLLQIVEVFNSGRIDPSTI